MPRSVWAECCGAGVWRKETGLRIVVPTGVYERANFARLTEMKEHELTQWMIKEIREGIEGTGVKADSSKSRQ
jgi:predicted metal-dependent phosphotriesterase family hydrolase